MDSSIHRIVWGLFVFFSFAFGHPNHHRLLEQHHDDLKAQGNPKLSDDEGIFANAPAALSGVNKARVKNPSFNEYEMTKDAQLSVADPLKISGKREFSGFLIHQPDDIDDLGLPTVCQAALTKRVLCDWEVESFADLDYRKSSRARHRADSICDAGCGQSLRSWYDTVAAACDGQTIGGSLPMLLGGYMWAAYNETCLKSESGDYCNDVIAKFTRVSHYTEMPLEEMCSACYAKRFATMNYSPYSLHSLYREVSKEQLEYIYSKCGLKEPTQIPSSVLPDQENTSLHCGTDEWYTTSDAKETCNSVALKHSVSSAALFNANQYRLSKCYNGTTIGAGTKLCIPPRCPRTYILRPDENCFSIEYNRTNQLQFGDIELYNPGVGSDCFHLHEFAFVYGTVLCLGPQLGQYNNSTNSADTTTPQVQNPYTYNKIAPPKGAKLPEGTTERCGGWHVAEKADTCARICAAAGIHIDLLLEVNSDLGDAQKCSDNLAAGNAYCVRPNYDWKVPFPVRTEVKATYYFTFDAGQPTKAT
ncbi:hypothetical protein FGADI_3281 [Fusarium gaditjirri]|uniref:LysM domain-containing protein n=1 Tax=Fusarium gaditjirri TaxID=282569 RepID=A0A8H4TFZ3_9HYPO|nr:hypothetical protein FGADI_3281 [Fusarium gaditjirri]